MYTWIFSLHFEFVLFSLPVLQVKTSQMFISDYIIMHFERKPDFQTAFSTSNVAAAVSMPKY